MKITLKKFENVIENLINNYNLYKQCKDLLIQIKPISVCQDVFQWDSATLADACSAWLGLMKNLCNHTLKLWKKRMSQSLEHFHFLEYLLYPKYQGDELNSVQIESARLWATEKFPLSSFLNCI